MGGMRLLPAAHLHAAPCKEVRLPTGHIVDRLDIVRIARIGGNIGKADHHVVKGQLLAGQLVHRVLIGFFGAVVHFQLVAAAPAVVGQAGPVTLGVGDADGFGRRGTGKVIGGRGAVIGKVEERRFVGVGQADAGITGCLFDLLAGGELGVFIGYIAAAAVTVGNVGVNRRVEVALAADVQAGVIVYIDELGAENALAIVVIEGLMGHEQLQELVAAGAQRPDLRDGVRIPEHGTQAGDAALHLALDEQVCRADAALGAGVLPFGVGDVVDHHTHHPAGALAGFAGQRVSVVGRQKAERRACGFAGCCRGGGCLTSCGLTGCGRRGCSGLRRSGRGCRRAAEHALHPVGQVTAQNGTAGACRAAGERQQRRRQPGIAKYGPSRNFHGKSPPIGSACPARKCARQVGCSFVMNCFDCTGSCPVCKGAVRGKICPMTALGKFFVQKACILPGSMVILFGSIVLYCAL